MLGALVRASRVTTGRTRALHFAGRAVESVTRARVQVRCGVGALRESPFALSPVLALEPRLHDLRVRSSATHLYGDVNALRQVCADYFRAAYCVPRPGEVVVDAGANVGWYSIIAALLGARVEAFEPHAGAYQRLVGNLSENGVLASIEANAVALGDSPAQLPLLSTQNGWQGTLAPDIADGETGQLVDVVVLDDFLATRRSSSPSVVKVDVEGYEAEVARGACRCLASARLLVAEWHSTDRLGQLSLLAARAGLTFDARFSDSPDASIGIAYFRRG